MKSFCVSILISLFSLTLFAIEPAEKNVVFVSSETFRQSMEPWIEYRAKQGYAIHWIKPGSNATEETISREIRKLAKTVSLSAILIVGNAYPDGTGNIIACPRIGSQVIHDFGDESHIASDNLYADLDGDGLPDVPIGRFSVDTTQELDAIIRKTIKYESNQRPGPWSRRINLVAGVGGFTPVLDQTIESSARYIISRLIPPEYDITLTQADWRSPYCPPPNRFRNETLARLNEGCLLWVYLGHGDHRSLDYVFTPDSVSTKIADAFPIFSEGDTQFVSCKNGSPIAVFLACYTGALDARDDCIAEELHRLETGPVAVLASSRTSMPYGMASLGIELLGELYKPRSDDESVLLGEVVLAAERQMVLRSEKPVLKPTQANPKITERPVQEIVDSMAAMFDPTRNKLDRQRLDHLYLFQLFGDPLLQIPRPLKIAIDSPDKMLRESTVDISGTIPRYSGGQKSTAFQERAFVEIAVPKSRNTVAYPKRQVFELTDETVKEYNEMYEKSNRRTLLRADAKIVGNRFDCRLSIPKLPKGEYDLRVYYESNDRFGLGAKTITVQ